MYNRYIASHLCSAVRSNTPLTATTTTTAATTMGGGGPTAPKVPLSECATNAIWRQRLKSEAEAAHEWRGTWGFMAERPYPPPRAFSTVPVKYTTTAGQWTNSRLRIADDTAEGAAAARSEQDARKAVARVDHTTRPALPVKPCETKGVRVVRAADVGVESRTAAKLMLSHTLQTLGDACRTDGMDPGDKYVAPQTAAQEVGWYAANAANGRRNVELFGVAEYGVKNMRKKLFDMVP